MAVQKPGTTVLLHPFNGIFSGTMWVSWHQKRKPFWILVNPEMMGWQWHQLDRSSAFGRTSIVSYHVLSVFADYQKNSYS